ncbi:MAG TPA: aminotransferase class I/II-fold pyridoxal phosphate-dependent enzyme [Gemmatimonadota bacterium]|nr:aminotransferase class I/II-fold pyridoxal phosphate-dependent enzyme [Gemmatimonadota bacterium]
MTPEEFREAADLAADWIADYRRRVGEMPVLARVRPGQVEARIPAEAPEEGEPFEALVEDLDRIVLPGLTHWCHPGFFAYFPSSSSPPAVLAEFVAAALNQNAMLWRTSPAATELETRMAEWLRRLVGLPDAFRGVLQDTASQSSFTALLAAREAVGVEARERGLAGREGLPALAAYVSEQAHSSLEKAAIAAGLGQRNVRKISADAAFRMDPGALERALEEDEAAGIRPVMVGATIGTTSTASVDPAAAIAEVCEAHGVWLHVDAAYAGPAAILPEQRGRFAGWERADSIVLNPHKWLATPVDCSLLLFRDPAPFRASLALTPEYLSSGEGAEVDLMDYGLSLGRRFRALKLWFLMRWHGAEGLRDLLRHHIAWAEAFAGWIRDDPRFVLAAPPSFSTVCFRALPAGDRREGPDEPGTFDPEAGGEAGDALARRILERVNREGRVFLSHTALGDRIVLRLSVGSYLTREEHVRGAYEALGRAREAEVGEG